MGGQMSSRQRMTPACVWVLMQLQPLSWRIMIMQSTCDLRENCAHVVGILADMPLHAFYEDIDMGWWVHLAGLHNSDVSVLGYWAWGAFY